MVQNLASCESLKTGSPLKKHKRRMMFEVFFTNTGHAVNSFDTEDEAIQAIKDYERQDRIEDNFVESFYGIREIADDGFPFEID